MARSFDGLNLGPSVRRAVIGIVVSRPDRASVSIGDQLLELADWTEVADGVYRHGDFELREFEALHLELDRVADAFDDAEYVVFASKHSGDTGPLLSAHFTGNYGAAEYGGSAEELVETAPGALKHVIQALDGVAPEEYEVSMECTHHGPTELGAPGMFVELGSGKDQWEDERGAEAVAKAILELDGVAPDHDRTLVAVGGNHYAPQPTRILRETDAAIGHVAADWSIEEIGDPEANRGLIETMFERSHTDKAVLDGEWPAVRAVIESLGYRVVSETWVRETSGVDPDLVAAIEAELGSVADGLRFGDRTDSTPRFVDLPEGLIEACAAVDPEATVTAVRSTTVAYQTTENGNRVGERAAVPDQAGTDAVIDALIEVLSAEYESVERDGDAVLAVRNVFDPELAKERGVPEGPLFGKLAAGRTVTVDGKTVEPETVHTRETNRFDV